MTLLAKTAAQYEKDWYAWAMENVELLRQGRLSEIDAWHIAEELEDMGKGERLTLASHLKVLITHLLKWQFQPAFRGVSWQLSIDNARDEIDDLLDESPSLSSKVPELVAKRYPTARKRAMRETGLPLSSFPSQCPYNVDELLNNEFWPD